VFRDKDYIYKSEIKNARQIKPKSSKFCYGILVFIILLILPMSFIDLIFIYFNNWKMPDTLAFFLWATLAANLIPLPFLLFLFFRSLNFIRRNDNLSLDRILGYAINLRFRYMTDSEYNFYVDDDGKF